MDNPKDKTHSKSRTLVLTSLFALLLVIIALISLSLWLSTAGKKIAFTNFAAMLYTNSACDTSSYSYQEFQQILHHYSKGEPATWNDYRDAVDLLPITTGAPIRFYLNMMIHNHGADQVVALDEETMLCQLSHMQDEYIGFQGIDIHNDPALEHLLREYIAYSRQYAEHHGKEFGYKIDKNCPKGGVGLHQVVWNVTQLTKNHTHNWEMWSAISELWSHNGVPILQAQIEANKKAGVVINNSPESIYKTACDLLSSTYENAGEVYGDLYDEIEQELKESSSKQQ
ncbi:hypothetical protein EDC56_1887 [Sinobacterium caligoides]|uniref:Uncharacterized protein n=1 Tax=Sinobacterium caligoides TaxID=933926 RepID=A0A3N2DNV6_9GAMM|nr:hypothetical protein [Sinobacterium caligoides]ROS01446.1 hypothetical protein EDC56_1887 [Sinobacterium caligoides]